MKTDHFFATPLAILVATSTAWCPLAIAELQPPAPSIEIEDAIDQLGSTKFAVRQAAYKELATIGGSAIQALERAARSGEFETATRCTEVLAVLARDSRHAQPALAALKRLAVDPGNPSADRAAEAITELKTTDEERAIAALEDEGVKIRRARNGKIYSLQLSYDRQLMFLKYLPHVHAVYLTGKEIRDVGLASLVAAKGLTTVSLTNTSVTEKGLRELKNVQGLRHLFLNGTSFKSSDLWHLQFCANLRTLSLPSSADEADLWFLTQLPQLDSLHLSDLPLGHQGVATLNQLDHLRRLHLTTSHADDEDLRWIGKLEVPLHLTSFGATVTTAGLKHLGGSWLRGLSIRGPISDDGLAVVERMTRLESLSVVQAPISDAGLERLRQIKTLRFLSLHATRVTKDGIARLQRSHPKLRIAID